VVNDHKRNRKESRGSYRGACLRYVHFIPQLLNLLKSVQILNVELLHAAECGLPNADAGREWYASCNATMSQARKASSRAGCLPDLSKLGAARVKVSSKIKRERWKEIRRGGQAVSTEIR
jgi:hypothetical protein